MADVDPELLERITAWCAEAGRQTRPAEIRRALSPLGWDDLLAVRALLADPPPARPLGPHALADIARGAPPEVAAERERERRYLAEEEEPGPAAPPPAPTRRKRTGGRKRPGMVIRRARDRLPAPAEPSPRHLPPLEELRRPEGRSVLERLLRRLGARRAELARTLAAGWRRADGSPPEEEDVSALLDHHGLARAFARREHDELLHALRAAGGLRAGAAARLALDAAGFESALVRLGAVEEAEAIREERRAELRARATLSERVRLLLAEEARLRDLELLAEIEGDLRARLPEHLRALRAGRTPLREALARSLSLEPSAAEGLARRFGIDLGPRERAAPAPLSRKRTGSGRSGGRRAPAARGSGPRRPARRTPRDR